MKIAIILLSLTSALATEVTGLEKLLHKISNNVFTQLQDMSYDIWENPELGLLEFHAHDITADYFQTLTGWDVTPHPFDMATGAAAEFAHRPDGFDGEVPAVGFVGEFDALPDVGHACGHNLLWLNAVLASRLAAEALVELNIPGRILLRITPDEENGAGKYTMEKSGGFDDADVWLMAHPSPANMFAPGNVRLNLFSIFKKTSHQEAVKAAYQSMLSVHDLASLPGTASSVALIEEVGDWAVNVVQQQVGLGILGTTKQYIDGTVSSIIDETYRLSNFVTTNSALAASDASVVQRPEIDATTKEVLRVAKVVMQPLFNICEDPATCGSNHEPLFAQHTATDFAFGRTEVMGRAQAHTAIELLTNPKFMSEATALIRSDMARGRA